MTTNTSNTQQKLILVDGNNYAYRAFYAIPNLSNSKGFPTNAIFGFTNMLLKLLRDLSPRYMAVVFDVKGSTMRQDMFKDYKANRKPMPDLLRPQFDYIKRVARGFSIPVLEKEGIEADDIIGTLARRFSAEDLQIIIASGDKDLMQLVTENTVMIDTMKDIIYNREEVQKRFGVGPEKVTEILGLMGDAVDNIPGVPGIGPKGALRLIEQFGSIEEILNRPHQVYNAKLRNALMEHADLARMSRDLATIDTHVDLSVELEELETLPPDTAALLELFKECEFSSLLQEIKAEAETLKGHYTTIQTEKELASLAAQLENSPSLAIDCLLTAVEPMRAELAGIALSPRQGEGLYIPLVISADTTDAAWTQTAMAAIAPLLGNPAIRKNGHNLKAAIIYLEGRGVSLQGIACDTMIASYLLNPLVQNLGLAHMAFNQKGLHILSHKEFLGAGVKSLSFSEIPADKVSDFACRRVDAIATISPLLTEQIKTEKLDHLLNDLEIPLISVLASMERHGVLIDGEHLKSISAEMQSSIHLAENDIYRAAGERFNINSPKQLQTILFEKLKLPKGRKIKEGYSTDGDTLAFLAEKHELPAQIIAYRSLTKLKSTYIDALPLLINAETGRIHTSYNQTVTATGRLSSSNPNLQNIPIRTQEGKRIRQAFIAPEGCDIVSADYSQIELRIMAHLSGDQNLKQAFLSGEDIHRRTASDIFGVFPEMVTAEMRRQAKVINFGILYGMSAFGLSKELGLPTKTAQTYIDGYFAKYRDVSLYFEALLEEARKNHYVTTLLKRRRFLPDINSRNANIRQFAERTAINTPIQGTAADLIKMAMINIHRLIGEKKFKSIMIMQVHDELIFETPLREKQEFMAMVKEEMEGVMKLDVPLIVDISSGKNWDEAH
ncbi:MAG: DNA polymerase I [Syntrophobacterales bacterium]|jgi:DNA polymerase-1|nr:DNA polymerase I [Syntrophobacterales bacterium]